MPSVKYIANADPLDGTGAIRLEPGESGQERVLVRGGPSLEVSDQEFASLKGRYQITEVTEEDATPEQSPGDVPEAPVTPFANPSPAFPAPSTTMPPAEGGQEES